MSELSNAVALATAFFYGVVFYAALAKNIVVLYYGGHRIAHILCVMGSK